MSIRLPITFLAVAQIGATIYTCLTAAMVLKVGRTFVPQGFAAPHLRSAYLTSHWGWLLLVLPVAWFLLAAHYIRDQRESPQATVLAYASGALLFLLIICLAVFQTLAFFHAISG